MSFFSDDNNSCTSSFFRTACCLRPQHEIIDNINVYDPEQINTEISPSDWRAVDWISSLDFASDIISIIFDDDLSNPMAGMDDIKKVQILYEKHFSIDSFVAKFYEGIGKAVATRLYSELRKLDSDAVCVDSDVPRLGSLSKDTKATKPETSVIETNPSYLDMLNMQSKFSGLFELNFDGLDSFYGGLEGIIGAPRVDILTGMEEEHWHRIDSNRKFTAENHGITTTSQTEWNFVVKPNETEALDPSLKRKPEPLESFLIKMKEINLKLLAENQPELTREEVIGLRLYTGPMYVKYSSVLRGLRSKSQMINKSFVQLCGPNDIMPSFSKTGVETSEQTKGKGDVEDTSYWSTFFPQCNFYTTTLHAVNSGIVKLAKLTPAYTVYRGIAGATLPKEFWQKNKYEVCGGVDAGFMSTTTSREVALHYSNTGVGVVFEIRQGMVDRGADVRWVSQFPNEDEILFGPLTGIEVLRRKVEGTIVHIEARLSVNLLSQTIEQVIGKRRKLLTQMKDDIILEVTSNQTSSNQVETEYNDDIPNIIDRQVDDRKIFSHESSWYNRDDNFMVAVSGLLAVKNAALQRNILNLEMPPNFKYHAYMSYTWSTGLFKMHVLLGKIREIAPGLKLAIDVEQLDSINFEQLVCSTMPNCATFFLFYSEGYFRSKNCRKELFCAIELSKPIVVVYEGDSTVREVMLTECYENCLGDDGPGAEIVLNYILREKPLLWISVALKKFAAVSNKLVILKILKHLPFYTKSPHLLKSALQNMVPEVGLMHLSMPVTILVCEGNFRAQSIAEEARTILSDSRMISILDARNFTKLDSEDKLEESRKTVLLLYLNDKIFLDGGQIEYCVKRAIDQQIQLVLIHEQDPKFGGCRFSQFFTQTPQYLQEFPYRLFDEHAIPFYANHHYRKVGLQTLLQKIGAEPTNQ